MPVIHIYLDPEMAPKIPQDKEDEVIDISDDFSVTLINNGMQSGNASVMIRIDLPDGRIVLQETSLALFTAAARAMEAAYHRN